MDFYPGFAEEFVRGRKIMKKTLCSILVALALTIGLTGLAAAQETTGNIVATVKDTTGAAIAGATVTASDVTNDLDDMVFTGTRNPENLTTNTTLISVNGARSTQNTFTVDGADITDRGSNLTIQAYPSVESIGEFQVLRSLYPAESGRGGGGQVNIITRSGGNKFHGSAYEFVRNEKLNANDFL